MTTPVVAFTNVSKIYLAPRNHGSGVRERVIALADVNLKIHRGERVGIIGRNGAGKTTLLRAIGGTINLTGGTVRRQAFPRMVISLGGSFLNEFTGHENLYLYASFLGMLKSDVDRLYAEIVAFSGLASVIHEPLRNYSTGMRTRLAFAIATAGIPELICLDELLSAGDFEFQTKSAERMRQLSATGTTAVVTHHNLDAICDFATRLIWLEHGQIRADGSPKKVRAQYETSLGS